MGKYDALIMARFLSLTEPSNPFSAHQPNFTYSPTDQPYLDQGGKPTEL